jgi:hypothetical protein
MGFNLNILSDFINKAVQGGKDIRDAVLDFITPDGELLSPLSANQPVYASQATPQPTPTPKPYRNPNIDTWKKQKGNRYSELESGSGIASKEYGIPQNILMDLAGLESQMGMYNRVLLPKSATDSAAFYKSHTAKGPYMYTDATARELGLTDPLSATESARTTAKELKKKRLSRWDVVKNKGAGGDSLLDFYSPEELAPYLNN